MITYKNGDVLSDEIETPRIIPHVCNNAGGWGAGFVLALSRKWKEPEIAYRSLGSYILGEVQFVWVHSGIVVANMIAQHGYGAHDRKIPLDYGALGNCMCKVGDWQHNDLQFSITAPRFGAGLAGGKWGEIETMINSIWADKIVEIYDL